ncbi:MAG: proline--tRNA ligase [Candidatus Diapherotrites archaeon CG08_land_8_20_14_0_20_30_16]|nr:MAG: proline--tRNA ligase [Candidatus Diapherotrites archaeon CG08_land_8_20_14_0_20_30_16]
MSEDKALTKKSENITDWYNEVVQRAELADYAATRGFMVIRPRAYEMWEHIQSDFDHTIKTKYKVKNAYFPLLIPESFFKKEQEHAKGFSPEVAWIANTDEQNRLAIRPTSETIIYDSYSKWIRSWRDLPLRINQWCNIVRWEIGITRLFLRTKEFLWQEGHCVYANEKEARKEALQYLKEYAKLAENLLCIPVICGEKTQAERFAGAVNTYTIEAIMPDAKSLQMGTSHYLGTGFAKSFGIEFLDQEGKKQLGHQISWGFSTRLIGAVILMHGDDKGLVTPHALTETKIVIIPILIKGREEQVLNEAKELEKSLKSFGAFLDAREQYTPGAKFSEWELKGIPIRIEIGPKDLENKQVVLVRRDTLQKQFLPRKELKETIKKELKQMPIDMYNKAKNLQESLITKVETKEQFFAESKQGRYLFVPFCGLPNCEAEIKEKTGLSSRCVPFDSKPNGKCFWCGKEKAKYTYFAKSY